MFMKKIVLLLFAALSAICFSGCVTSTVDISGAEFVQKVEGRKPGEKVVLRRDDRAGYFYADWFVMPPTQSVFKLEKTFRTSTNDLNAERFEALKKKVAEQDANSPYPH
jgi:hypothetical protein